jgi:hypothetical protein
MSEEEAVLLSIILNMAIDGKADLSKIPPSLRCFVEGALEEYYEDVEENEKVYHYALETLTPHFKRTLH